MDQDRTTRLRPPSSRWATTALLATAALALAAGCGSRLSADEIAAGNTGVGGSSSSAGTGTGTGSDSGTSSGTSSSGTTGVGAAAVGDAVGVASGTSGTSAGTSGTSSSSGTSGTGTTGPGGGTGTTGTGTGSGTGSGPGSTSSGTTGAPVVPGVPKILGGSAPCVKATGTPVNIGNVSTLSGVLGEVLGPVRPALNLFVKSQNECGGLNGHPIKFSIEDDQGDPSTAVTAVKRLINTTKVIAFVSNIQLVTVDAIVQIIKDAKIPVVGSDLTNNTWYTNPYFFPQGAPPQATSYGYLDIAKRLVKQTAIGDVYCLEVPVACLGVDGAYADLAPRLGMKNVLSKQVSITAPSYISQCLEFQNKGAKVVALSLDGASQGRFANSCARLNPPYKPQYIAYPLGVGNEQQFFGAGPSLGNTYVPLTTFGWMKGVNFPSAQYYQDSISKYGFSGASGNAASLGWTAGALLVRASQNLPANPTSQDILDGLYRIKGDNLGKLSPSKLTFKKVEAGGPAGAVQYCYYVVQANPKNDGWITSPSTSKETCTATRAGTDPNK